MKKIKRVLVFILALLVAFSFSSVSFAQTKLSRPVIDDVTVGKSSIKLDWDGIYHSDGYDIYRSTSEDGPFNYYDSVKDSEYRDYDVNIGTRYYYKIRAISYNGYADSSLSKWRSGKIKKSTPKIAGYVGGAGGVSSVIYVYKADTGKKYHKQGCSYLRYSSTRITLSDAKAMGLTPCSRCYG